MKSRSQVLFEKSVDAIISAIEIYNKPDFKYRGETFSILAINAWELLLKSKWLDINDNKIESLYVYYHKENKNGELSKKKFIRRNNLSNTPYTHGLFYFLKNFNRIGLLHENIKKNIILLNEVRNFSVHLFNKSNNFDSLIQEIGSATIKNFINLIKEWFCKDLTKYNFYLMPLGFINLSEIDGVNISKEEENFFEFIQSFGSGISSENEDYSIFINFELKTVKSKSQRAIKAILEKPGTVGAEKIELSEEDIKERFPWEFSDLIDKIKNRYNDFKQNNLFWKIKSEIEERSKFVHIRLLNPHNPKSHKKKLYNSNIIKEFDKYYSRK